MGANYYADKLPANGEVVGVDKREGTTPDDGADVELAWTNLQRRAPDAPPVVAAASAGVARKRESWREETAPETRSPWR